MQSLCGPNILAYRPQLWRWSILHVVYKKGNPRWHGSYRLIFVKVQMGLLQEGLIAVRLKHHIFTYLRPCQSGYLKGIEDPHLVMHELCSVASAQKRTVWGVLGDFQQSFPRVWRELLLNLLHSGPHIRDGMLSLLGSILHSDQVHIWLSGRSEVMVKQGVPEGGNVGPLCYNLLPDTLVRRLEDKRLGFGIIDQMPSAWCDHSWAGDGYPDVNLVACLAGRISGSGSLPSANLLKQSSTLEASAAMALDIVAPARIPCMFHADDPGFFASSKGGLQLIVNEVEAWSKECGAKFHTGPNKTVCMCMGENKSFGSPITCGGVELSVVSAHKWLGILWPDNLDFHSVLQARLQQCGAAVSQLAGLVHTGAVSWVALCELFESKVDSLMEMGRWLFVMVPDAESLVNSAYDNWAKTVIGADWYRNRGTCTSELGWAMSGYHRVVLVVAMRRARLWVRNKDDWHRSFFFRAAKLDCGWARRSL